MEMEERLKELIMEFASTLGTLLSDSTELKKIIENIEREDYQLDLIITSIMRITRKEGSQEELKFEFNALDKAFLESLKIRLDKEKN